MGVEGLAAWWLHAYLVGEVTGEDLAAEVRAALASGTAEAGVEVAVSRYVGVHPSEAVRTRGAPRWTWPPEHEPEDGR